MKLAGQLVQCVTALPGKAVWLLRRHCAFVVAWVRWGQQHLWEVVKSPEFRRSFMAALGMDLVVSLVGYTAPGMWLESLALDKALAVNTNLAWGKKERRERLPEPLFIDVDERTWRSPAWGGGEPRALPLPQVAKLIEQAALHMARYIVVDFNIEGEQDAEEQREFAKRMGELLQQLPKSRLLFVRSFRRPLEQQSAQAIRPSYAVDMLMAKYPNRVFAVAPTFEYSDGLVLRHWRLWESACYPQAWVPGEPDKRDALGEGVWAVVPSPQLMIAVLEAEKDITSVLETLWLLRFAQDAAGAARVVAPGEERRCVVDTPAPQKAAGEKHEAYSARRNAWEDERKESYSARLADWQAGKWVQKHHRNICYQQGFFTKEYCDGETEPKPVQLRDEEGGAVYANEGLSGRVLFRHPDWLEKNRWAFQSNRQRDRSKYLRVAAAELLCDQPPCQSQGVAADRVQESLARFAFPKNRSLTVAVIGASYDASRDFHMTPLGRMPGALVLVNAIDSLQAVDFLQDVPLWKNVAIALICAFVGAAAVSKFHTFFAMTVTRVLVPLLIAVLCMWLIKRGFWLNIAAPFIGIWLERTITGFLERRKSKKPPQHNPKENT